MAPPLKTHCKRGHPFTATNTKLNKLSSGYTVRQCKRCRSEFEKLRYHNNPKRQAAVRARRNVSYYEARP
ncbi:hypothetical protein [Bradyrhizobium erythrophlei]|uniref:Uncharacterized protein n=1 Tax=Bradyrhizobium erythrophlei TaxID=1437360 RepID=A0A1M5NEP0_9BRAD|nr:hypothetical protein [Bradyrhizobium erythrophlei]SHG87649.1 hypothetical protein SAMN05443248_2952 [Bradyrhizobium erythrophlei]